jgi:capsular polysaccharide biosynthesis protein
MNIVGFGSLLKNRLSVLGDGKEYYFAFNPWGTGYYHWLTEIAIKFVRFEDEVRRGTVLLPENCPNFVTDLLTMLGINETHRLTGNTFLKRLNVITNPDTNQYNVGCIERLRDRVLSNAGVETEARVKRIYISRQFARSRRVVNETDVIDALSRHGFECFHLENLPFREQVGLFSHAEMVVSIHGAGLANMIFAPRTARVLELYPGSSDPGFRPVACFQRLCNVLGQKHRYLFCDRELPEKRFDLDVDNIIVDTAKLEETLAGIAE